jgi:hypoxanthine phosphoribosyltransferase
MRVASRVFEHRRLWRLTPHALHAATTLLADAILRDHCSIQHVIGIANGGTAPARLLAATFGLPAGTVRARHNLADSLYQQATGTVTLDLDPLTRTLNGHQLPGRVLIVDDICGSGATLRRLRYDLTPWLSPNAEVLTAVLCLNTGASTLPDYSIWTVSDWVVFPWEQPSAGRDTTRCPPRPRLFTMPNPLPDPLTVAFVLASYTPNAPAGMERATAGLAQGLRELGHRSLLLTAAPVTPNDGILTLNSVKATFPCDDQQLRHAISTRRVAAELRELYREHRVDIAVYVDALWGLGCIAPACGVRSVLAMHVVGHDEDLHHALARTDLVIAPSPVVLDQARNRGYQPDHWQLVPNPLLHHQAPTLRPAA